MTLNSNPKKALRGLFARTEPTEESPKVESSERVEKPAAQALPKRVNRTALMSEDEIPSIEPSSQAEVTSAEVMPAEVALAEVTPAEVMSAEVMSAAEASAVEQGQNRAFAINQIQYGFDLHRESRMQWGQTDYLSFIRRIDASQTEAFFLKGKLLDEVKERFFESNRTGWVRFCDEQLSMNYTTANQYINVAREFDVTAHQRTDFGFEHFKALLPLPSETRQELVRTLPEISVKALRAIVQEKTKGLKPGAGEERFDVKGFVGSLLKLKEQIQGCQKMVMTQSERWQASAASRNLSDELRRLALYLEATEDNQRAGAQSSLSDKTENTAIGLAVPTESL